MKLQKTLLASVTLGCASAFFATGANACNGVLNNQNNEQGTHNGYYYSFWKETNEGQVSITCGEGGDYGTDWSNVFNWVGGKGWFPGGPRVVSYEGTFQSKNANNQQGQNSYLALYGWTRVPTEVEYYVVESYGSYNPASCGGIGGGGVAADNTPDDGLKGSYTTADGSNYDMVQCTRANKPSISGNSTFKQFFSVRNPPKPWGSISGTIDVAEHFDQWARAGMRLGNDFDYMVLATEGYGGNGRNASGDSNLRISEGPGEPVDCGNQGGTPVCCSIAADPDGDGMGEQNGNACVVTMDTEGWHEPNPDNILAAINVGGTGEDVQMDNIWYAPNQFVTGADPYSTGDTVSGANSSVITTEGYGENITIDIPMSNQWVSVDLSFAEMYQTEVGARAFSVSIEGEEVLTNVDLFDEVGHDVMWKPGPLVVRVTDGRLNIRLTSTINNATISAVLVTKTNAPVASSSAPVSSSSVAVSSSSAPVVVASSSAAPVASSSSPAVVSSSSAANTSVAVGSFNGWLLMVLGSLLLVMRRTTAK